MSSKPQQKEDKPNTRQFSSKVDHLKSMFPKKSEAEIQILLTEYNGSVKLASEAILSGGDRWMTSTASKAKKDKKKEQEEAVEVPRDFKTEKKKFSRPAKAPAQGASQAAPQEAVTTAPVINQKTDIVSTTWSKGTSISFADMLKKKQQPEEKPQQPQEAKQAISEKPQTVEKVAEKKEKTVEQPAAKEEPKKEAAASPVVDAKPSAAAEIVPPKPRRERKPRDSADAPQPPAPAVTEAPAPAAVAAPAAPVTAAPPRVVKYVIEFDTIAESLTLPSHVQQLASRFSSTYTFSGVQGRAPTPPAPQQVVAPAAPIPNSFAVNFNARPVNWSTTAAEQVAAQQQPQAQAQQAQQQRQQQWDAPGWNNSRPSTMNFTSYQQQQYVPRFQAGYRYQPHQQSHYPRHMQEAPASDYHSTHTHGAGVW